jgi:hypothetical protein
MIDDSSNFVRYSLRMARYICSYIFVIREHQRNLYRYGTVTILVTIADLMTPI